MVTLSLLSLLSSAARRRCACLGTLDDPPELCLFIYEPGGHRRNEHLSRRCTQSLACNMKGVTQHAGVPMPLDQGGSELKLQRCVCFFKSWSHRGTTTTHNARPVQTARPRLAEGGLAHAELKAPGACGVGEGAGIDTDGRPREGGDGCHEVGVEPLRGGARCRTRWSRACRARWLPCP